MLSPNWIQAWKLKEAYDLTTGEMITLIEQSVAHRKIMDVWYPFFLAAHYPENKLKTLFSVEASFPEKPEEFKNPKDDLILNSLSLRLLEGLRKAATVLSSEEISCFLTGSIVLPIYGEDKAVGYYWKVECLTKSLYKDHLGQPSDDYIRVSDGYFHIFDANLLYEIFKESVLIDKIFAIRYIQSCSYSLQKEVIGLSRVTVDAAILRDKNKLPLESELAETKKIVEELKSRIAELEAELEKKKSCYCKGYAAVVCDMLRKGSSPEEIDVYLLDKFKLSRRLREALLDTKGVAVGADALRKRSQRRQGKA